MILALYDADRPLKFLSTAKEFAIKGDVRQILGEPGRGEKAIAEPGNKRSSVPIGANSIEFLAQPPVGQIEIPLP